MAAPLWAIPKAVQGGKILYTILMLASWSLYLFFFIRGWGTRWFSWIVLVLALVFTSYFIVLTFTKKVMNRSGVTKGLELTNPVALKAEGIQLGQKAIGSFAQSIRNQTNKNIATAPNMNPQSNGNASKPNTKTQSNGNASKPNTSTKKNFKNQTRQTVTNSFSKALSNSSAGGWKNRVKKGFTNSLSQVASDSADRFFKK